MLPFLKNRQEGGSMGPVDETISREPDEGGEEYGMLDAIAEDMIEAFKKTDKRMLKDALEALCEHLKDEDQTQDEEIENDDQ